METKTATTRVASLELALTRDARARLLWLVVLAGLALLDWRTISAVPVHHDIAWPLYLAHRMLAGARLYADIFEVHPPLTMWLAVTATLLSRVLGIADIAAYHALALAAVLASVLLSARLLATLLPARPWLRAALLALQTFLLLPFVGYSFGQEEHLMLALTWPYLLDAALAARGERAGRLGWLIGALGGLGFAMKPLYVLVWLVLEAYVALSRRVWRPRPELIAAAAVFAAYGAAIVAFTPAYFHMLTWAAGAYNYYFVAPLWSVVLVPQSYLVLCAVLADFLPPSHELGTLRRVAAIALVASTIIVYAQRRGWTYHWYPALALAIYLLAIAAFEQITTWRRAAFVRRLSAALAVSTLAAALLAGGGFMLSATRRKMGKLYFHPYYLPAMRYIVRTYGGGGPVMAISDIMQPVFPLVNYAKVPYASRFSCLWMLPGLYSREWGAGFPFPYHDARHTTSLERYMIDAVIEDIQRARPTLLIVDRDPPFMLPGFNYFVYFGRDARFREIMTHYTPLAKLQRYLIFKRVR